MKASEYRAFGRENFSREAWEEHHNELLATYEAELEGFRRSVAATGGPSIELLDGERESFRELQTWFRRRAASGASWDDLHAGWTAYLAFAFRRSHPEAIWTVTPFGNGTHRSSFVGGCQLPSSPEDAAYQSLRVAFQPTQDDHRPEVVIIDLYDRWVACGSDQPPLDPSAIGGVGGPWVWAEWAEPDELDEEEEPDAPVLLLTFADELDADRIDRVVPGLLEAIRGRPDVAEVLWADRETIHVTGDADEAELATWVNDWLGDNDEWSL